MEEDISNNERRLLLLEHEETDLSRRCRDLKLAMARLDDELDVCFESSEHDLARNLVRRKLEAQACQTALDTKSAISTTALTQLKQRLDENRSRLNSMRQKLELFIDAALSVNTLEPVEYGADNYGCCYPSTRAISNEEVEIAFLGEKQQRIQS